MNTQFVRRASTALVVLMVAVVTLSAQPRFKVLALRGSVSVKGQKSLKIGQQLSLKDQLKLGKDGYISLAHKNGGTVELRKAGKYKVKDLDAKASKQTGSSTSKFASYVVSQLTEVEDPIEFSDARRTKMRTTGSVERAAGDEVHLWDSVLAVVGGPGELQALAGKETQAVASGEKLGVITPTHTRLLGDSVAFIWHRSPKAAEYKVVVVDRNNSITASLKSSDTVIIASVDDLKLESGQVYYWHLEDARDPSMISDQFALYRLVGEERRSAEELVRSVQADYDTEQEAVGKLILAAAFEEMGLYYDAFVAYRGAIQIAPDVKNYKRMYADFLKRQGMNMDAYAAYR